MTGLAVGFLLVVAGFLLGYAVRGLTEERRLRAEYMASLNKLLAESEAREAGLADALRALEELRRVLRVPER